MHRLVVWEFDNGEQQLAIEVAGNLVSVQPIDGLSTAIQKKITEEPTPEPK